MARIRVRDFIHTPLQAEIEELSGQQKSEHHQIVDRPNAYRNGYWKKRKLTLSYGNIKFHRPIVRGLEDRFNNQMLPLFGRRTKEVNQLIPELSMYSMALGYLEEQL